jgi:hypothetical protein
MDETLRMVGECLDICYATCVFSGKRTCRRHFSVLRLVDSLTLIEFDSLKLPVAREDETGLKLYYRHVGVDRIDGV